MRELEKEIEREGKQREKKKKKEDEIYGYTCVMQKKGEKNKEKGNIWRKEWKYYHNTFTIFTK